MTGIAERTVGYIVNEVPTAIVVCLWEDTVKNWHMPKSEEFRSKILLGEVWQFPCCWSAVEGCHIPIFGLAAVIPAIRMTQSFFSPLIYGIKSRTRNISPKLVMIDVGELLVPPLILGDAAFP